MSQSADRSGSAKGAAPELDPEAQFRRARDQFLSSLCDQERRLYSPCVSPSALKTGLEELRCFASSRSRKLKWLAVVNKLTQFLQPYFKVVDTFVSSDPQYAALVWGAVRLVIQLAGNLGTFLDKLSDLLLDLANALPQYDEILTLSSLHHGPARDRIQDNVGAVYRILLQILRAAARVFTKPDGSLKRAPAVIGGLIWRPFAARFDDLVKEIADLRQMIFQEVLLLNSVASAKGQAQAEEERRIASKHRQLSEAEIADAAAERRIVQKERQYASLERQDNHLARAQLATLLSQIQEERRLLEKDRIAAALERIQRWIGAPNFLEAREKAAEARQEDTAIWIFDEANYTAWLDPATQTLSTRARAGTNFLWIHGSPGAGKTTLAASILEELELQSLISGASGSPIHYFFFDYRSPAQNSPLSAYRSILTQILWSRRDDKLLLDQFSFAIQEKSQGQLLSSGKTLIELLHLCLDDNATLVIDGLDECVENGPFIRSLQDLAESHGHAKMLVLSRANVDPLIRWVPEQGQIAFTKDFVAPDIFLFCHHQLELLVEENILPEVATDRLETMVNDLVRGADGMFLWARLMINFLRSPFLTPMRRLQIVSDIKLPEGLEEMYERILSLISSAGRLSEALAMNVLLWTINAVTPMPSSHLRQALIASGSLSANLADEDPRHFEDSAIMACASLITRVTVSTSLTDSSDVLSLQLVHQSAIDAVKQRFHRIAQDGLLSSSAESLIFPDTHCADFQLATACLRQLLYHTPSQPLAGAFGTRISAQDLASRFAFTGYAAVHWMGHIGRSIARIKGAEDWSAAIDKCFSTLSTNLAALLRAPAAVSVWLESFYTEEYYRTEASCRHPPSEVLADFVSWLGKLRQEQGQGFVHDTLMATVRDFNKELDRVVSAWGDGLQKSPDIIWDEMTGFVHSTFFFAPSSTKVSCQPAQGPSSQGVSRKCLVVVSQTSNKGDIKGVLSIWSPAYMNDRSFLAAIRKRKELDVQELCQDWLAIYEIWLLNRSVTCAARVQIPIPANDILSPLQGYLSELYGWDISLPITISQDATRLIILGTLYVLKCDTPSELTFDTCLLPPLAHIPTNYRWKKDTARESQHSYSAQFCPRGRYLCLWQWQATGNQSLTLLEIVLAKPLKIVRVGLLEFNKYPYKIPDVCFHPTLALVAFYHFAPDGGAAGAVTRRQIRIWQFRNSTQTTWAPDQPETIGITDIQFSQCGKYVICKNCFAITRSVTWYGYDNVTLQLQLPDNLLDDPASTIPEVDVGQALASFLKPEEQASITRHNNSDVLAIHQALSVDNAGNMSSVAVSVQGNSIVLSQNSKSATKVTRLCAIPNIPGIEATRQELILPRFEGDTMKISVDNVPKSRYSLVDRTKGELSPAVIERDPRFIALPQSIASSVPGLTAMLQEGPGTRDSGCSILTDLETQRTPSASVRAILEKTLSRTNPTRHNQPAAETPASLLSRPVSSSSPSPLPSSHNISEDSEEWESDISNAADFLSGDEEAGAEPDGERLTRYRGVQAPHASDDDVAESDSDVLEIPLRRNRFNAPQ